MLEIRPAELHGTLVAPPSKSETHRALLLAALAGEPSRIGNPLRSADTLATLAAIQALGAGAEQGLDGIEIRPALEGTRDLALDCANSGTTLRLVTAIAATRPGRTRLDGDASLRRRPMAPLLDALVAAGVAVDSDHGHAPLSVKGPLRGRDLRLDSPRSSQFASGLLLALVADGRGGSLSVAGEMVSAPYLEMTLRGLARHGVAIEREALAGGGMRFQVPAGLRPRGQAVVIPGDWSSAAFGLCGGALAGQVRVNGLPPAAEQADGALIGWLSAMGASVLGPPSGPADATGSGWLESRRSELRAIDANLADCPDLFPMLAVTLAHARGRSRLHGAPHLRGKETDRIAAVARNLAAQGVVVRERPDGIEIEGPARLGGGPVETDGDHRLLMAFAVGATAAARPLTFADPDPDAVTAVSWPGFLADFARLGAEIGR